MPDPKRFKKRAKDFLDEFVHSLNLGEFQGDFTLKWITPELFSYTPDPADPFRFLRKKRNGGAIETITPLKMKTSGGSIPQLGQLLLGTTPWEYGPAYMIHDWEFEAHDRAKDGGPAFDKTFEEVNLTLAEAIWTLGHL